MKFLHWLCARGVHRAAILASLCVLPSRAATFNVRLFGARADGQANDAPAIQAAEVAAERTGGGEVYLPAGRYLVNDTILIGSNIDFHGDGNTTVLIRTNHLSLVPMYRDDCGTLHAPTGSMRILLTNRHYNCIDSNLHLHDFMADGSRITSVPLSCFLCFSGLRDSMIERITVTQAPQDAMFFRNGGDHLVVQNNTILMHNRLWGNGEGINVEMHKEGHLWGGVIIRNNTIVTASSNFCTAVLDRACATDSDCAGLSPPTCGRGASTMAAIGVTWVDSPRAPAPTITGNHIWVGNHHYGIICNGCSDATISGNAILPATMRGLAVSGTFTGISSYATTAGEPHDLDIEGNTIEGDGRPGDGPAILVSGHGDQNSGLTLRNNVIANKVTSAAHGAVEIRGWRDVKVTGNILCGEPRNSLRVGTPSLPGNRLTQHKDTVVFPAKSVPTASACGPLP